MDYGFAPGSSTQEQRTRMMFARRTNTTLVTARRVVTMRGFASHLATSASVARPIGDALLGAHGNSSGLIFTPMFAGQHGPTSFETLEATLLDPTKSVVIDDAVIGYSPGDPVTHALHFKGCNVGKALPFVAKFREALGDHVEVTAPLHFHGLTPASIGVFEYMAYEFSVQQATAFATRADLLAAFDAAGFTFIDGAAVAPADWEKWVPQRYGHTQESQARVPLGIALGRTTTINVPQQFRAGPENFTWTITYPTPGDVPAPADRLAELETSLGNAPNFLDSHPFPVFQRLGFDSVADFVAGHTWRFGKAGRVLTCNGSRMKYTVVTAIMDRSSGNLLFNFYPNAGSALPAVTPALVETDSLFFARA